MNEQGTNNMLKDFNRLSFETISKLSNAANDAMKQLQGDGSISDAFASELYRTLFPICTMASDRWFNRDKAKQPYQKMTMHELLKELYLRLQMFYHYCQCKGRECPGIECHMEPTGVFAITLNACAVNMESSFEDWQGGDKKESGTLFCISLNLPLLENENPEDPESSLVGEYDEFMTFACDFKDSDGNHECRDVYPSETYSNEEALRNILGALDMISKMNNEKK